MARHTTYTNLDGTTPDKGLADLLKWQLERLGGGRARSRAPFIAPFHPNDGRGLAATSPHLTWIGHATFVQRMGGKLVATDPKFAALTQTPTRELANEAFHTILGRWARDEWDVEGVIADRHASRLHSDPARNHKGIKAKDGHELALAYVDAYAKVYDNLKRHAEGYPPPERLRQLTVPGWNDTDAGVKLITADTSPTSLPARSTATRDR